MIEMYSIRLPREVKRKIRIIAAMKGSTQQELIKKLIEEEYEKKGDVKDDCECSSER